MSIEKIAEMVKSGELRKLHTSLTRGYVSRKSEGYAESYKGKFGEGFALHTPNFRSTSYHYITYFVKA